MRKPHAVRQTQGIRSCVKDCGGAEHLDGNTSGM